MIWGEALGFSVQALRANPVRSFLTGLGMVIGTASVILVVTISLTSQEYILNQIEAVGSNMVFASFDLGNRQTDAEVNSDFIKLSDVQAVRDQLADRIVAASGVETNYDQIVVDGNTQRLLIIGSDEYYRPVRNLVVLAGRFLDHEDIATRARAAVLTQKLAARLYGAQEAAVGQTIRIYGLQFKIIGTFKEKVDSIGQSELNDETVVIPISVQSYFAPVERIDPLYVQARSADGVIPLTKSLEDLLESRHRPGTKYKVENLVGILDAAKSIGIALQIVLLLVSAIALVISGIGIMNIMLVTVTERTREIGLRMAVGASRKEILEQFLTEALLISVGGGGLGILAGISVPAAVDLLTNNIHIPISGWSIAIAFAVSCAVGLLFGMLPADRASRLNPTEALRFE
ncbi:ABC transporter permease [Nevskia soli]|uniref:ABC transporter permease n=1 Tax=Nevskia soli TaxID=418856 RepID=UPI0015D95444|nr:ABC transporter permease [Nevskia soli]